MSCFMHILFNHFIYEELTVLLHIIIGIYVWLLFQATRVRCRSRPKTCMFYCPVIFYFFNSVSFAPKLHFPYSNFFYIIFRLKYNTSGPTFGSLTPPKINDFIKSAQKCNTLDIFFWKLTLSSHSHVVLAPIYDTTLLFNNFPPTEGEIAPIKNLLPLFSRKKTFVNF